MSAILFFVALFFQTNAQAQAEIRPFAEYEPVKFVVLSAGLEFQSLAAKRTVLENLPAGITPVIYASSEMDRAAFAKAFPSREDIRHLDIFKSGETFWPRDSWPFPVVNEQGKIELVDAPYYEGFEPDPFVADFFRAKLRTHGHYFEHGNLAVNRFGDCLVVQEHFTLKFPDAAFTENYGCQRVIRLPFVTGIGHADEVVKFLGDDLVVTSREDFMPLLQILGYRVHLLPEAKTPNELKRRGVMPQRSYVNSLLLNDTVFVPTFKNPEVDEAALSVYRSLGLKVLPVESTYLADYGGGALHCFTMTYPDFTAP